MHVVDVSVGERGRFERCMHMHKFSSAFPRAEGDAAFGSGRGVHDESQFFRGSLRRRGVGQSFFELHQAFRTSGSSIRDGRFEQMNVHGHHPGEGVHLPAVRCPNHQSGAPELRRQLATKLPTRHSDGKPHQADLP